MDHAARICGFVGGLLLVSLSPTHAEQAATAPASSATQPGKIVQFQPNVRIDYGNRQVEVDGRVILREGLLELFACSPHTREHESIVLLNTQPVIIFQALGLLGLEPGHPLRMDPNTGQIIPASGQNVEIDVSYELDGTRKTVPIENWMRHSQTKAPLDRQPWVFAGSLSQNGGIAADEEGTIVAVVDFESALVALPRQHTASNAELWLEPNTPAIPPLGTPCTVVFRPGPLSIRLDKSGRLFVDGKAASYAEAAHKLREHARQNPKQPVEVTVAPESPAEDRERLKSLMEELRIEARRRASSQPATSAPDAGDGHSSIAPSAEDSEQGEPDSSNAKAVPRWIAGFLRSKSAQPASQDTSTSQPG